MNFSLWLRFAARDLRSGLQGFWIFLTCLALGTAAIAIIGSLSASIERGLDEQGQPLLGGDVEFSLVHREATDKELAFIASNGSLSKVATLRAMAIAPETTTLVEIKATDALYPLYGQVILESADTLQGAMTLQNSTYGVVVDPLLLGRLGVKLGDKIRVGTLDVEIRGAISNEPDRISDGFILGPRILMSEAALKATGLIQPGSLVTYRYRVRLENDQSLKAARDLVVKAKEQFPDAGWQLKSRDRAAQGAENFVDRLSYFLTLVGLTSLIVGGAGIVNAVSAFVDRRIGTIATLKCLGAPARDVFWIYLTEIMLVALLGIAMGIAAGAATPVLAHAFLQDILPLPLTTQIEVVPLALTAALGLLVTIAFSIWPLARTHRIPASALFRHRIVHLHGFPRWPYLASIATALAGIATLIFLNFENQRATAYYLGGLLASFVILLGLAHAIVKLAEKSPKPKAAIWRYAISNLYRPGSSAVSVILALGLGLTLFVTLALTDQTISQELRAGIPEKAPAFFFLDVRNEELPIFVEATKKFAGVREVANAPMLRGRIARIGDTPVDKVRTAGDGGWALRGDRGLTYSEILPEGSVLVEGQWWKKDYSGPPLVSFVDEIAQDIGLKIGDSVTVNVLGRDVTAKVANFRKVNWRTMGINFVMVFSPNTLKSAPHSHIVTVEMEGGDEAKLLNTMAREFPTSTAVRIKEALATVSELLGKMLGAIRGANALTLLTGILVLAGALAAGLSNRIYDAVVLKTYGASRAQLMGAFIIEYAVLGLAAAIFGIAVGSLGSWFLATWILDMQWSFSFAVAATTALLAMIITIAAGLMVTWRALAAKPAPILRNE
ncbi:MAG TPA: FtsX-like permease family protein [Aestuariivirga sp.]|jgi:putative ABC transport system permease protein|nr:FtsX-like permease family protein [Aestuariivirga sp.]